MIERDDFVVWAACCAALTKLSLDDSVAMDIRDGNGVYLIASFLLLAAPEAEQQALVETLQVPASRAAVDPRNAPRPMPSARCGSTRLMRRARDATRSRH